MRSLALWVALVVAVAAGGLALASHDTLRAGSKFWDDVPPCQCTAANVVQFPVWNPNCPAGFPCFDLNVTTFQDMTDGLCVKPTFCTVDKKCTSPKFRVQIDYLQLCAAQACCSADSVNVYVNGGIPPTVLNRGNTVTLDIGGENINCDDFAYDTLDIQCVGGSTRISCASITACGDCSYAGG